MQNLTQDIKNHSFKPVYLLYGDEAFLKNSYKNQLKNAISGDDTMNYNYFEGKGLDLNELISLADTMPWILQGSVRRTCRLFTPDAGYDLHDFCGI